MCECNEVSFMDVVRVVIILTIFSTGGYFAAYLIHGFSADVAKEVDYWRARYPEEHKCAKQNGFKIGTDACLECW